MDKLLTTLIICGMILMLVGTANANTLALNEKDYTDLTAKGITGYSIMNVSCNGNLCISTIKLSNGIKLKVFVKEKTVTKDAKNKVIVSDKTDEKILEEINTASVKAIKSKYLPVEKITTKTILNKVYDFIKEKI